MIGARPWMSAFREARELSVWDMAKVCKCSPDLLRMIEREGAITHPHIAARIAAAYRMDVEGYNELVANERRVDKLPKAKLPPANRSTYKAMCERGFRS